MTDPVLRSQPEATALRQLLPCPFCGEKGISLNEPSQRYRYGSINCPACLATMPGEVRNQNELIGCWNDRASLPLPEATGGREIDALTDRVHQLMAAGCKSLSIAQIVGLINFVRDGEGAMAVSSTPYRTAED